MNLLSVVVLAAGKGKRMNNPELPKVLANINNFPLIYYVLNEVVKLSPLSTVLVTGHKGEMVREFVNTNFKGSFHFAIQEPQLGTGHAVLITEKLFYNFIGNILILAGDVPNISASTLVEFIHNHNISDSDISVLSALAPNPYGYGRIIRDGNNDFIKITEHKDANESELEINEINSGIILAKSDVLFDTLHLVGNNNNQNEYYLTDIIEIGLKNYKKVK